jgi:hypothetical protein
VGHLYTCVCVCVCVCARARVCECVCERETVRACAHSGDSLGERGRERELERGCKGGHGRSSWVIYMCVCVCERERERERDARKQQHSPTPRVCASVDYKKKEKITKKIPEVTCPRRSNDVAPRCQVVQQWMIDKTVHLR